MFTVEGSFYPLNEFPAGKTYMVKTPQTVGALAKVVAETEEKAKMLAIAEVARLVAEYDKYKDEMAWWLKNDCPLTEFNHWGLTTKSDDPRTAEEKLALPSQPVDELAVSL